jgi:L-ascorbate metabolism protein UlaG (beta-lactamase superfamily)
MRQQSPAPLSVTFIGTATTLLRLGPFTLLTDPNFLHAGQRAYLGYGLSSRRRTNPAIEIDDLPPLDAVLLSHLHGDHFDRVARDRLPRAVPILTTPHAERRLRRRGFRAASGLPTWEEQVLRRDDYLLRVTAVPAQHGPAVVHRLLPPTMGSIVDLEQAGVRHLRLYITGDTLYRPWLTQVARRFPDIDATLVHLGGTRVLGVLVTMDGTQGAQLATAVPARLTLPIHYDDYGVFRSPLSEFLDAVHERGVADRIRVLERGQTTSLAPAARP